MPVQEQTPYIKYVANGVTQTFSTGFDCESKDQLVVMLNGEEPSFTSWSYADKQVTFLIAPVVDTVVELKRQSKLNRTTDYQSFNHTLNYKALNSDFDRIWYAIQEQNYKVNQYDVDYNFVLTQVRPITTGGTGADNVVNARSNLNVYSKAEVDSLVATGGEGIVLGIGSGGTGSTTEEGARAKLDVYSQSEVDLEIEKATPNATTTVKGIVQLATTAEAQTGTNDTKVLTPKKMSDVLGNSVKPRSWSNVTASRIADTWYANTTGNDIGVFVSRAGVNISASVTVRKTGTSTELSLSGTAVGNNFVVSSTGFWEVPDGFDYKISVFSTVMELRV